MTMISTILVMGSMLGIGALLTRHVRFNEDTRSLFTTLIIFIAIPSLILICFLQTPYERGLYKALFVTFLISLGLYISFLFFTKWMASLVGLPKQQANELAIISSHGNTGFIGLPLCIALLGAKGGIFAIAFDLGIDFCMFTISVILLKNKASFSPRTLKSLLNAPVFAAVLGVCLYALKIEIPDAIFQLLERLGAIATPLALIYIGFLIPKLFKGRKQVTHTYLFPVIGIKLLLMPVITAVFLAFLNLGKEATQVILIMSTMPTGALVPIVFSQYKANDQLGASATIYSTLLSLVTIPMMFFIGSWIIDALSR